MKSIIFLTFPPFLPNPKLESIDAIFKDDNILQKVRTRRNVNCGERPAKNKNKCAVIWRVRT